MDWRVFLTTFGTIFLAEMGDKTQLAAMTMAAETKKPLTVFVSASLESAREIPGSLRMSLRFRRQAFQRDLRERF